MLARFDWNVLGPIVERYVRQMEADVARDTRKHAKSDAFRTGVFGATGSPASASTIKGFAELRRAALLNHAAVLESRTR